MREKYQESSKSSMCQIFLTKFQDDDETGDFEDDTAEDTSKCMHITSVFKTGLEIAKLFPKLPKCTIFRDGRDPLCVLVSKLKYSVHRPLSRKYRSRWDTEKKPQTYLENNKFYRTNH